MEPCCGLYSGYSSLLPPFLSPVVEWNSIIWRPPNVPIGSTVLLWCRGGVWLLVRNPFIRKKPWVIALLLYHVSNFLSKWNFAFVLSFGIGDSRHHLERISIFHCFEDLSKKTDTLGHSKDYPLRVRLYVKRSRSVGVVGQFLIASVQKHNQFFWIWMYNSSACQR